jgi:recombination protein RecR
MLFLVRKSGKSESPKVRKMNCIVKVIFCLAVRKVKLVNWNITYGSQVIKQKLINIRNYPLTKKIFPTLPEKPFGPPDFRPLQKILSDFRTSRLSDYLYTMNFSSKLLEDAVAEFAKLPGVGQKTALRLVLHLLNQDKSDVERFSATISKLRNEIQFCRICLNISDHPVCQICASPKRDHTMICVVEDTRDVMAIENTNQYNGVYHVLGGLISPMDGIGPTDLEVDSLVERLTENDTKEVIFALSATMEGDTTLFYLHKRLKNFDITISTIARGIAFGGELEYVDEITLGRSIATRVLYVNSLSK